MRIAFLSLLFIISCSCFSQPNDFGAWNVVETRLNLTSKWRLFNELQLRSHSFYQNHYYYEVKGGVTFMVNKNFQFLLGAGKYITYAERGNFEAPIASNEFRLWQQLTMNHFLERIKFEHRYRVEQRWFKAASYRNRFRYRLNTVVPVNSKTVEPKTFYLTAFEEVFFTNTAPYFERNRFFAGAGYQLNKQVTIQPGWLYQFDYRNNAKSSKHFFQLMLLIELHAAKNPHERIPGNTD